MSATECRTSAVTRWSRAACFRMGLGIDIADKAPKLFRTGHENPGEFRLDYILLPYGLFYEKTSCVLKARRGDRLRLFNGPDCRIIKAVVVEGDLCDLLCRMRYGVAWRIAYQKWLLNARMEGFGKDVFFEDKCIFVVFDRDDNVEEQNTAAVALRGNKSVPGAGKRRGRPASAKKRRGRRVLDKKGRG